MLGEIAQAEQAAVARPAPVDLASRGRMDSSFFPVLNLDMAALEEPSPPPPDALGAMYRGSLGGCLVRGFVPASAAVPACERLEAGEYGVPFLLRDPTGRGQTSGFGLGDTSHDLDGYTAQTAPFHEHFPRLFRELPEIERRFAEVLARISGGRRVEVARGPGGAEYLPMLVRRARAGCLVPPHFELQVLASASYDHLVTFLDTTTVVSFYFQLSVPEAGGELYIHDVRWEPSGPRAPMERGQGARAEDGGAPVHHHPPRGGRPHLLRQRALRSPREPGGGRPGSVDHRRLPLPRRRRLHGVLLGVSGRHAHASTSRPSGA